jgi:UDP-N-acetylglucosamine 1-carboxyvinyltransferase
MEHGMEAFRIQGGRSLRGTVAISGAKNAALPIMAAAILADGPVRLQSVPQLTDVDTLARLLRRLGVEVSPQTGGELKLVVGDHAPTIAGARLVHRMRASFCVLGPLVARRGRATVALPGGCRIGSRPVDLHLMGLSGLGADVRIERGYVVARARRLRGADIDLTTAPAPTVTGTANLLCAATLARGKTVIRGAAREPEIVDLGRFLNALGADITGLGTSVLEIHGVEQLGTAHHALIPDRIEAGTLLLAAAITGGDVTVAGIDANPLESLLDVCDAMGCDVRSGAGWVALRRHCRLKAIDVVATAYPGLPTDLQAQVMAVLCLAEGRSFVRDQVFPERFRHVDQLRRFAATIRRISGGAVIDGVPQFAAADCKASDLRASAALVLAGLAGRGETMIRGIEHLDRGYERFELKLARLGAAIERVRLPRTTKDVSRPGVAAPVQF